MVMTGNVAGSWLQIETHTLSILKNSYIFLLKSSSTSPESFDDDHPLLFAKDLFRNVLMTMTMTRSATRSVCTTPLSVRKCSYSDVCTSVSFSGVSSSGITFECLTYVPVSFQQMILDISFFVDDFSDHHTLRI
ncbi:hypothetical protein QVD17_36746 [Tagetes erecta]|uniref:Uncharacterized protein n=1 Tax=Tagetes erecta TaxID=13708 RepID=A0AAD8JV85_TARER|nr:hypothetical protein QVD17_36746 [Tagetes erecta]